VPDRHEPDRRDAGCPESSPPRSCSPRAPGPLAPPALVLESRSVPGGIVLRASVPPGVRSTTQRRETLDALERGLRARSCSDQSLRSGTRPRGFLGDRLLSEFTISRTARWDLLPSSTS